MTTHFSLFIVLLNLAVTVISVAGISRHDFPPGFIFGSATSAYQVEGAADEDGRTPSIWDAYAHAEYFHGGNGDVTSDQYHKYKEDVQLMAETGLDVYRFSISWSRLIPNGRGAINPKGLQYYNNLINELISHGIQPHVTLHHFDLPQALEDEYGGWVNRAVVRDFTAYADVCFREFGDRVTHWTTINEVNVFSEGYSTGFSPPGRCSPPFGLINCTKGNSSVEPYLAAHNMLLSHASAARLYEKKYKTKQHGSIGLSIYTYGTEPLTDTEEDITATQRFNEFYIGWILHPLVFGDYPDTMKKNAGSRLPVFTSDESKLVNGSFDFIGVINYLTVHIKDDPASLKVKERDIDLDMAAKLIYNGSLFQEYPITPWGLEGVLKHIKQTYGNPPVYILENGQMAPHNSSLEDTSRIEYLHAYIGAVLNAVSDGSDVKGYIQWSFLDVYELLAGFKMSFGLYYVDFTDRDRSRYPKLSARWYSDLLKGRDVGPTLEMIEMEKNLPEASPDRLFRYEQ